MPLREVNPPAKSPKKAQREVAFEKFALALSDQQLVTGIAILITIFANYCRTSRYELKIAISLAWFSSTTHFGTLDVLHRYFRQNVLVRNWRMVAMVGMLILFIPGLVLVELYVFYTTKIPIQCARFLPNSNSDAGIGPLAATFVIMYLCTGYGSRLYETFTAEDGSMMDPEWLIWDLLLLFSSNSRQDRHAAIEKAIIVCNTRRSLLVEAQLEAISTKYSLIRRMGLCIWVYYARSYSASPRSPFFCRMESHA